MGRKGRIEYKGAYYHVIQRGNNKNYIFNEEEDKLYLMGLVKKYQSELDYLIYGFVIMDNHYHIVMQTLDEPLNVIMHRINNKYSKYYNCKYSKTGHVFGSRYKAYLAHRGMHLLYLIRYIHHNPVKANLCEHVKDYKYSSDIYYRTNIRNKIVNADLLLNLLSDNRKEAIKIYKEFMDVEDIEEDFKYKEVLEKAENEFLEDEYVEDDNDRNTLDEILLYIVHSENDFNLIKNGSRKRYLSKYKIQYIKKAIESNYTLKEIGDNISISAVAVLYLKDRIPFEVKSDVPNDVTDVAISDVEKGENI